MAKSKVSNSELVTQYLEKLDKPTAQIIGFLRTGILDIDNEIAEQIKWNSPSFYYSGEMKPFDPKEYKRDIVVMNLHRGKILLVFPTGAIVDHDVLEGNYTDGRRLISIADMMDAESKLAAIQTVIKAWLQQVEK